MIAVSKRQIEPLKTSSTWLHLGLLLILQRIRFSKLAQHVKETYQSERQISC